MNDPNAADALDLDLDTFGAIYERDTDLVLALGLSASERVRALVLDALGVTAPRGMKVRHSVATEDGREADLVLEVESGNEQVVVELENKLNAVFQSGQAESYSERARNRDAAPGATRGLCVLVAPRAYLESHSVECAMFDACLAYEELRAVLLEEGPWGRAIATVLQHAVARHRRSGSALDASTERTRFFADFAALAHDLGLPKASPGRRIATSSTFWFDKSGRLECPKGWDAKRAHGAWLGARLEDGWADVELTGVCLVADVERLEREVSRGGELAFERRGSTIRLRRRAPQLDPDRPLDDQLASGREFVEQLAWLRDWWRDSGCELVAGCLRSPTES